MTKKDFIDSLQQENASFTSDKQARKMANLLNTVSSDIYSESQRFVFELIQNADDAAIGSANIVHFNFLKDGVIVSHNGKSFDEEDIASIADAGASTKAADPTKTGYKGIGFKSVFGKSDRVSIRSDGYFFRFDKAYFNKVMPWQGIPIWSVLSDYPEEIQYSLNSVSYNVSTIIEVQNAKKLERELDEIINDGQILLFLRFTTKIIVSKNGVTLYDVEKKLIEKEAAFTEVMLLKNEKQLSNWLTKTFDRIPVPAKTKEAIRLDEKTPEKLKGTEFIEISFAARLEKGKIVSLKNNESLIFTYLPTKVKDFNFPFLVNSSFITSAARESVNEDKAWNQWLFEIIAGNIFKWLSALALTKFKYEVLHILPKKFDSGGNELKNAFNRQYAASSVEYSFVITANEQVKRVDEVLVDKTGLSDQAFLDDGSIVDFLRVEKGLNFSDDCFVNNKVEQVSSMKPLGVLTFDADNIELFFNSGSFKSRHRLPANFALIAYFKELSDADASGIWFQALKTLNFIFDNNGQLRNPSNGICFPFGITATELGEIPVINEHTFGQIQASKPLLEWLGKLGVKEPSNLAYVSNVIVPGLKQPGYINENNYLPITYYLFRLFKENKLDAELLESLRELKLKVIGPPVEFIEAQKCYLSARYRPRLFIQDIITEVSYVSEFYLAAGNELEWNIFFKAIKVKEDIEIEVINSNNSLPTIRTLTNPAWVQVCYDLANTGNAFGLGEWNVIFNTKIPSFLNLTVTNYDYAKIFWARLIDDGTNLESLKENARLYYGVGRGYNSWGKPVGNYFPWFVQHIACMPASDGRLHLSTQVYSNDKYIREIAGAYLPVFNYTGNLANTWKSLFNFKDRLTLEDYLSVLSLIAADYECPEPKETLSVTRIGNIYNRLASMLEDMGADDLGTLSAWGAANKLYATNSRFEFANTLCWVTIEGFSIDSANIKTIRLPSIAKDEKSSFRKLMVLFGIKIIDEFIPQYANPKKDNAFKVVIGNVLPYFAALIFNRSGKDIDETYDELHETIDETTFYSAEEIRLSFQFEDELFHGPLLTVYRENDSFYFKGKWKSERTLLALIKELAFLVKVKGLNEELRFLLLEQDENELLEWLKEQQINLNEIPAMKRFSREILAETGIVEEVPATKAVSGLAVNDLNTVVAKAPKFEPEIAVDEIDITAFKFQRHPASGAAAVQITNYEPVADMDFRLNVGRWSEVYVNKLLKQLTQYSAIQWVNEHTESGKPYDFKVTELGIIKYIEVKGTPSDTKNLVYLSAPEWNLMLEQQELYSIFRVYNAGNASCICQVFENPAALLASGAIQAAITL